MSQMCHRCYKVVPRACQSAEERDDCPNTHTKGRHTWTAYVEWKLHGIEELDVVAADEAEARQLVAEALAADYMPGGRIVRMVRREPGSLYL